ncbi:MAG: 30S ribosomal protein S16 [Candidatus Moranbacteria bacterium]|nr:30S ribosomal protein S16 [Candidatus Moranbacteria bacterium]
MLKIRLTRKGKRNKAFFRLVVAEHTSPIKGRFLEALGFLNPHTKEKNLKADRIKYWIGKGAQCSDTAHNLLVKEGIVEGPKRAVKMKKADKEDVAEKEEKKEEVKAEKTEETKTEKESEEKTEKEAPAETKEEK